jgi:hypothetical protein
MTRHRTILTASALALFVGSLVYAQTQQITITGTTSDGKPATVIITIDGAEPPPPPPPVDPLFDDASASDPEVLGTCTQAVHDQYIVSGGDGFRYRTWHAQDDSSGCKFGHEHGENPATQQDEQIRSASAGVPFGQVVRKARLVDATHPVEPHPGFKFVVFNVGDKNSENRTNRMSASVLVHTGTGNPRRAFLQHHSALVWTFHPEFPTVSRTSVQLMFNTGVLGDGACDPRTPAPAKDIPRLDWNTINPECVNNIDMYEIWNGMNGKVFNAKNVEVYRAFTVPAVRDPITVINPANQDEIVYAWDPRVMMLKKFQNSQTHFRGCNREQYTQFGHLRNRFGVPQYWTNAFGNPIAEGDPAALLQVVPVGEQIGLPVNSDGSGAWKDNQLMCAPGLGLKN